MFRPAFRTASTASFARLSPSIRASRRFVSTAPPHKKSRSWKSSAARWGAAGALVYYYNTASVFAEEPEHVVHTPAHTYRESESYPTVASISDQRRAQTRTQLPSQATEPQTATYAVPDAEKPAPGSPEELEQEASEEGAFNEETGEINWDCPCLGGMAYGPCGEQFRAAFSCFVFSKEEPKGVDCIEHFKAMQTCFREHPDVYGAELEDDEASAEGQGDQPTAVSTAPATPEVRSAEYSQQEQKTSDASRELAPSDSAVSVSSEQRDGAQAATERVQRDLGATSDQDDELPKSWHDARSGS